VLRGHLIVPGWDPAGARHRCVTRSRGGFGEPSRPHSAISWKPEEGAPAGALLRSAEYVIRATYYLSHP